MKYCRNCGKEMADDAVICTSCGVPVSEKAYKKVTSQDSGGFGWNILGFFVPLVGLILFLVWKEEKPVTAKAVGLGALIGVITEVVLSIVMGILYATILASYVYAPII